MVWEQSPFSGKLRRRRVRLSTAFSFLGLGFRAKGLELKVWPLGFRGSRLTALVTGSTLRSSGSRCTVHIPPWYEPYMGGMRGGFAEVRWEFRSCSKSIR